MAEVTKYNTVNAASSILIAKANSPVNSPRTKQLVVVITYKSVKKLLNEHPEHADSSYRVALRQFLCGCHLNSKVALLRFASILYQLL